jgi:lysophospholipase L1-like esterase
VGKNVKPLAGHPVMAYTIVSSAEIWNFVPSMPYRVIVNKQGFRSERDLDIPKKRQRVLCLGDSYTFGPYLPNHDTYPDLLNKLNPDLEVINAGICGFTITDETSLFIERAKYIAPDITILQVVANDITGLFWFMKNEFNRKRFRYGPTPIEKELMDEIVRSNKMVRVLH